MAWWAAAAAVVGGLLSSKAQKDAAKKQADAIESAGGISQEAVNAAIANALNVTNPALADHFTTNQNSIDLFNQGRVSSGNLIASGYQNAMNTLSQGGQASINALLGLPPTAPPSSDSPDVDPATSTPITSIPDQQQPTGTATTTLPTGEGVTIPTGETTVTVPDTGGLQTPVTTGTSADWDFGPGMIPEAGGLGGRTGKPRPGAPAARDIITPEGEVVADTGLSATGTGPVQPTPTPAFQDPTMTGYDESDRYYFNAAAQGGGIGETGPRGSGQIGGGAITPRFGGPTVLDPSVIQPSRAFDGGFAQRDLTMPQAVIPQAPAGTTAGLAGTEQALMNALAQSRTDLGMGTAAGLQQLGTGFGQARQDIGQGRNFALNQIQRAMSQAGQGYGEAAQTALAGAQQGVGFLSPYMQAGTEALDPYLALSGVRGQEAFDAARLADPAYQLALQESERALGRQAALTGTLGSGNVMAQLQENAQLQAAADIDRQLGRLRQITGAGQQAAGTAGGLTTQAGIAAGGLQAQGAGQQADLGRLAAQYEMQTGQNLGQLASQLGMNEAQLLTQLGGQLSQAGLGIGGQLAGARETAGLNLAQLIQQQTGQQAGLQTGLATDLSNLDQQTLANIANTMQQAAGTQLGTRAGLGQTLANIGIGQGSQQAGFAQQLGAAQAAGVTNPLGNALNTFMGLYASGAFNQPQQTQAVNQPNTQVTNTGTNLYGTT